MTLYKCVSETICLKRKGTFYYIHCTAASVEAGDSCFWIAVGHFNESEKIIACACVVVVA